MKLNWDMTGISEPQINTTQLSPGCVGRITPRGPSASEMIHALIVQVDSPLVCIQCLWVHEPAGYGIELTAFFGGPECYSVVLLGGVHGDGERRVLGGSLPPFLEVAAAQAIGDEFSRHYAIEFYFPAGGYPSDGFESWLDLPKQQRTIK
jgi:hypothetical protein